MSSTKTLSNAQVPLELKLEEIPELAASRGRSPAELKSSQPTLVGPSLVAPCSDDEEHPDKWNVVFADDGTDFRFRVRPHRKWIWVAAMLAIVVAASSGLAWKSLSARRLAKSDRFSEIAAGQPNIPPTLPRMPTITETAETREEPSVPLDPGFSDRGLEMQVSAPSESNAEYLEDFETLLSGSVGDVEAYCKLLNDWANQLPDSRVLEDFRLVLAEDPPAMMPLERCAAMLDRWATFNVREMSADEVRRNLAEAEQLLTEFPELDAAEVIRERCKVLRAIANRFDEAGNSICAEILRDLEHPAFALPFVLQTKDGKRFYLTKRPEMKGNALPCEYLVNLDGTRKTRTIDRADLDRTGTGISPLIDFARATRELLESSDSVSWESMFSQLVEATASNSRLDPLLKARWMHRFLTIGGQGSYVFQNEFRQPREELSSLPLYEDFSWLDPDDPRTEQVRQLCIATLENLPSLSGSGSSVTRMDQLLDGLPATTTLIWIGRLSRTSGGDWKCVLAPSHAHYSGPIFVVRRPSSAPPFRIDRLGTFDQSDFVFETISQSLLREARPVYGLLPMVAPR